MTGGLTSYPRSDGDPPSGPDLQRLDAAIHRIETAPPFSPALEGDISAALSLLARLAASATTPAGHALVAARARRLFALLFRRRRELADALAYQEAMRLGAASWKALHPIAASPLADGLANARRDHAGATAARDLPARRAAAERIGVLHAVHEMSALFGADLLESGDVLPPATDPGGGYAAMPGTLICGTSYNANLVFLREIGGERIVLVGEAKGGSAAVGSVRVTRALRAALGGGALPARIRQDEYLYARRCGVYMARAVRPGHAMAERRAIGRAILAAHRDRALAFVFATARLSGEGGDPAIDSNGRLVHP
ncbi:hypothetical protein [Poseidonocella sp. HB161398]|uniref:hypothetical protein n=1 Tax=Poseidonocella sp. HB161398 TaxID=2320855 RepID=UPI001108415C|nr:hypothetical protein [Poseidonocella sp. HB161398]